MHEMRVTTSRLGVRMWRPLQSLQRYRLLRAIWANRLYYLIGLPGLLFFIVFRYIPMFGIIVAFKDVTPAEGLMGIIEAPWVGLKHFTKFFDSYFFWNVMRNTVVISGLKLLWGFPTPIILALMINEVRQGLLKKSVQTVSYLPHFISWVVITGIARAMLSAQGGLLNQLIVALGGTPHAFLTDPAYFRSILITTHVWQSVGWSSILYLAAMASINPELYEAAMMDGASRWRQIWAITLPSINHVIAILFIFAVGNLLNAGFEQILLLYSPHVYDVADIIDTYVYREGLLSSRYSFASAVGLFKSGLALILLLAAHKAARALGQPGLWGGGE